MHGTIMTDYDGVLYPFSTTFFAWAHGVEGRPLEIIDNWYFYRKWGWNDEKFVAELKRYAAAGGFGWAEPLPGGIEMVQSFVDEGYEVVAVTDRPEEGHQSTIDWTNKYFPGISELMFSRDKTVFMEGREGPFWGLDDRIDNVEKMLDAGVEAYLLTRPWNEDSQLPRVSSLEQFYLKVTAS